MIEKRSGCPIDLALEVVGDRWSLIVIRDIMFGNRRHFRELLTRSEEGIATNILAARLKRLVEAGLLSRSDDPAHRQRGIYSLTEKAIQLVPVLMQLGAWGRRHLPTSPELAIRQQLMEEGGPPLWSAFADELRHIHLETPLPEGPRERHRSSTGRVRAGGGRPTKRGGRVGDEERMIWRRAAVSRRACNSAWRRSAAQPHASPEANLSTRLARAWLEARVG